MELNEEFMSAEEERETVAFIESRLPQDVKDKFTEDDIYYFLDAFAEYCETSGIMDDENDDTEIDIEEAAKFMVKLAKKEQIGTFDAEDVRWIVDGQLDYWDSLED